MVAYPFFPYDAGRTSAGFSWERNDCAVRALAVAFRTSYGEAHKFCGDVLKRQPEKGCPLTFYLQKALDSGSKFFGKTIEKMPECRLLVGDLHKKLPNGRYIVTIDRHVFALVNGKIVDMGPIEPDTRVYSVYRVK